MRIFKEPNLADGWTCPICHSNDIKKVTLLMKHDDYGQGKYTVEAIQAHVDCLSLVFYPDQELIYQSLKTKK